MFPRSISVIGERKESLKPENSPPSAEGNKKKFKWNIKVGECENKIGKILSIKRHLPELKNFFAATEASKYARDTCMSKKVLGTISSLQTFNNVECSNTIVNLMVVEGQQRCCDSGAVRYD